MFTRVFEPVTKRMYQVEYAPDTTEQMLEIESLLKGDREERPTLAYASQVCSTTRTRARVTLMGSYVGHIFEDGSYDGAVSGAFGRQ